MRKSFKENWWKYKKACDLTVDFSHVQCPYGPYPSQCLLSIQRTRSRPSYYYKPNKILNSMPIRQVHRTYSTKAISYQQTVVRRGEVTAPLLLNHAHCSVATSAPKGTTKKRVKKKKEKKVRYNIYKSSPPAQVVFERKKIKIKRPWRTPSNPRPRAP